MIETGLTFFGGVAIAQSVFLAFYFFTRGRSDSRFNWLALFFLALGLRVAKSIFSHVIVDLPALSPALGLTGLFLAGPSFYQFCLTTVRNESNRALTVHFVIPAIITSAAIIGFFDKQVIAWAYRIGTIHFAIYLFATGYRLRSTPCVRTGLARHLFTVAAVMVAIFFIQLLFSKTLYYTLGTFLASALFYMSTFYLIIINKEKYGVKEVPPLDENKVASIALQLEAIFRDQKLHRVKGLTLQKCAVELKVPAYIISRVVNQHMGTTFNTLVNRYRIADIKEALTDETKNDKVEYLARYAGFSGVSSLYDSFKRETGMTLETFRRKSKTSIAGESPGKKTGL